MIKTAGTTLNYIFRSNYGFNYFSLDNTLTAKDLKKFTKFNKNIKAISGHYLRSSDDYEAVLPETKYITFFRDPIERYISHYNHGNLDGRVKASLEDRLMNIGENDYQTKFILGAKDIKERSFIASKNDLERAKEILVQKYKFVGIVEKFDESLVLMKKLLNISDFDIRYQKKNVNTKKKFDSINISSTTMKKIRDANTIDQALFSYVKNELFVEQVAKYGIEFNQDLDSFKISLKNYNFDKINLAKYRLANILFYKPLLKFMN